VISTVAIALELFWDPESGVDRD